MLSEAARSAWLKRATFLAAAILWPTRSLMSLTPQLPKALQ